MSMVGFTLVKTFLATLVENLVISQSNGTQIGVVQFSDRQTLEIGLNQYPESRTNLMDGIRRIPFHNSGTQIGEAIKFTLDSGFTASRGDRVCSPDVLVVITDGLDRGNLGIPDPVRIAECRHILTIGVGVGSSVSPEELLQIGGGDPTRSFRVDNIEDLFKITDKLCRAIKKESVNPCARSPCSAGSTCLPSLDLQNLTCLCPPGFTGHLCEIEVNECLVNDYPCQNDGTCNDRIADFNCTCTDDYKGRLCQFEKCKGCPCWLLILLSLIFLLLLLILLLYLCCRKPRKVYIAADEPAKISLKTRFTQTPSIPEPLPQIIVKEIEIPVYHQPPPPPPETPKPKYVLPTVDILFLIDNSGSVGNSNFRYIRAFLHQFLEENLIAYDLNGEILQPLSNISIVAFNRDPKLYLPFTPVDSPEILIKIDSVPYEGRNTRMGDALVRVVEEFKKIKKHRNPKLCCILSDGFSEDDVGKPAALLHTMGVVMMAIAVRKINWDTFGKLAKHKDLVFHVNLFEDLELWLRRRMVEELNLTLENKTEYGFGKRRLRSSTDRFSDSSKPKKSSRRPSKNHQKKSRSKSVV